MRTALPVVAILILCGCDQQGIIPANLEGSHQFAHPTWELMEIYSGEWKPVTAEQKHFLTFISDDVITYSDNQNTCDGQYLFEFPQNSIPSERLVLRVPCMVPVEELWWEYMIEEKTDVEVIASPQLTPAAYMNYQRFKYRIIKPDNQ
jgi:hypothetical protein